VFRHNILNDAEKQSNIFNIFGNFLQHANKHKNEAVL